MKIQRREENETMYMWNLCFNGCLHPDYFFFSCGKALPIYVHYVYIFVCYFLSCLHWKTKLILMLNQLFWRRICKSISKLTINVKKSLPLGSFFDIKNIMTLTVKALTNSNVFATTISWAELGRFRALKLSILVMGSTSHND